MVQRRIDNVKLGTFVLIALGLLILFLYMLGRNQSIFSSRFEVQAHFENVNGLVVGNNVRVSGIVVGIVEEVNLVNDTLVVVTLALNDDMQQVLRKNALASIGTDGLIGNRVVNLLSVKEPAPLIEPGDILQAQQEVNTDQMLRTLDQTNQNVLAISEGLMQTVDRINESAQLSTLLQDERLSNDLAAALTNLRQSTADAASTMQDLRTIVGDVRNGEGSVGHLLRDTSLGHQLDQVVVKLRDVEEQADLLTGDMRTLVQNIGQDLEKGSGPASMILHDSLAAERLSKTLSHIESGTARFNENMEALKHNFLFRRYFKKQEKERRKQKVARKEQ